jgi:protein subunit release factor A
MVLSMMVMQEASASITGHGVYGKLKFESGVHRVQVCSVEELSQFL